MCSIPDELESGTFPCLLPWTSCVGLYNPLANLQASKTTVLCLSHIAAHSQTHVALWCRRIGIVFFTDSTSSQCQHSHQFPTLSLQLFCDTHQ